MKFYIFLLVLTQILFYFHLVTSATNVQLENENEPSKLKGLILSFLGLSPPPPPPPPKAAAAAPLSPPLNENNNNESLSMSKLLSNLPSKAKAMFSEINMKDIPEAIEASGKVVPTNDFDFMSRLMDLNKSNTNPSHKSVGEKNFLDRLMDIFFKRSNENDENEDEEEEEDEADEGESREKRNEPENNHSKDFGSLLYLGKRLGAVSDTNRHRANLNYANMYHSNQNQKSVL